MTFAMNDDRTFRLFPTIIFNTKNNSPFEIKLSRSMSYTLNATATSIGSISQYKTRGPQVPQTRTPRVKREWEKGKQDNAHLSFSSRPPRLLNALSPPTNSWKSTVPPPLEPQSNRRMYHHVRASPRKCNGNNQPCS